MLVTLWPHIDKIFWTFSRLLASSRSLAVFVSGRLGAVVKPTCDWVWFSKVWIFFLCVYLLGVGQRENTERNKISEKVMAKDKERQLFQIGRVFRYLFEFCLFPGSRISRALIVKMIRFWWKLKRTFIRLFSINSRSFKVG